MAGQCPAGLVFPPPGRGAPALAAPEPRSPRQSQRHQLARCLDRRLRSERGHGEAGPPSFLARRLSGTALQEAEDLGLSSLRVYPRFWRPRPSQLLARVATETSSLRRGAEARAGAAHPDRRSQVVRAPCVADL